MIVRGRTTFESFIGDHAEMALFIGVLSGFCVIAERGRLRPRLRTAEIDIGFLGVENTEKPMSIMRT